ncbi:MAG: GTPase Era [Gammaproteobacteria bacterium]|jgi:GTP-binding protein Era
MGKKAFRSGIVAILGRPNVGKSTLINALVGQKISIVTSKPQTTRHAIVGILTDSDYQAVLVDTPGLLPRAGKLINRSMNQAAAGSLAGADLSLLLVEAGHWQAGDNHVLERIRRSRVPCILTINKVDRVRPKAGLLPYIEESAARGDFVEIVPVSALKGSNLDRLKQQILQYLPEGECIYPAGDTTDRSMEFRVAELLREKLMQSLKDEVPYGLCVEIEELVERDGLALVDAVIWVDRESHKGIVVGRGGLRLKSVGRAARLELQKLFNRKFYLETRVKVKRNWSNDAALLRQLGYDARA